MADNNEIYEDWRMLPGGGFGDEEEEEDNSEVGSSEYVGAGYNWGGGELDIETELAELKRQLVITLLRYYVLKVLYLNYY